MLTTDLALKYDPRYKAISKRFLKDPQEFGDAFARAWFKLIHRDLGPKSRYLGNDFSNEDFIWQDPLPSADYEMIDDADVQKLKEMIRKVDLSVSDRIKTAWAAAASYRSTDMRGGINGARIRLAPQNTWEVNEPRLLERNIKLLKRIQGQFNAGQKTKQVSLADLIVIAGNSAVEDAAQMAGYRIIVPFTPGRTDASQEQTDVQSFNLLKVTADGFRNYYSQESYMAAEKSFVDRADLLDLTRKEMVVLTGGLRVLGANYKGVEYGELTKYRGALTNDYFINLLDNDIKWVESSEQGIYKGVKRGSGEQLWKATNYDLMFGNNAELRVFAFTYSTPNAKRKFVADFVNAWSKVMTLDRFDLKSH
ncbi:peroxidase family protein [Pseudobacteriovorax antillogorgiicola]|uniref:Catalase/peroxidase HPI n=1 Tax=Pseudobacteriovorax antillogorgiicola TaxID=1513793 RepID=A0A1Y6CMF0_9BACT|nr:peroxidase family protein [Pseudobacteriovorax antillogorgiicola]TCS46942.1 catalase/peroxidase HPI [Pseudobacteriovorax antillogorgiicola]SMF64414.1 catalase/peroxidase HPI [Pseudobacteriovorax antillogorgiicola]